MLTQIIKSLSVSVFFIKRLLNYEKNDYQHYFAQCQDQVYVPRLLIDFGNKVSAYIRTVLLKQNAFMIYCTALKWFTYLELVLDAKHEASHSSLFITCKISFRETRKILRNRVCLYASLNVKQSVWFEIFATHCSRHINMCLSFDF